MKQYEIKCPAIYRDVVQLRSRSVDREARMQEYVSRQGFLLRLMDHIINEANTIRILEIATRMLGEYFQADYVLYATVEADDCHYQIVKDYHRAGLTGIEGRYSLTSSYPVCPQIFHADKKQVMQNAFTALELTDLEREAYRACELGAFISMPLVNNGRLAAFLRVQFRQPHDWSEGDVSLIVEFAERTWAVVERAQMAAALSESERRTRQLVEHLQEMDDNKNRFISVLSHELRNPLAAIVMGLSLLDHAEVREDQVRKTRGVLNRQAAQLTHLVDDLLDVTRIAENKIKLKKEHVELVAIVRRILSDYQPGFETKGVALQADLPDEPLFLEADPVRLIQVIGNLLHNALKFTPPKGQVTISARMDRDRQELLLQVADTGCGIKQETLSSLFRPFMQADRTLDQTQGGLGLGLSIVKGMVELHGGRVEAESAGSGKGATFMIHMPLCQGVCNHDAGTFIR